MYVLINTFVTFIIFVFLLTITVGGSKGSTSLLHPKLSQPAFRSLYDLHQKRNEAVTSSWDLGVFVHSLLQRDTL